MYGYIYMTTNLVNNRKYIGQKKSSKFLGERYLGSGKILVQAVKTYGYNNFKVELLEECYSKEDLNNKEQYWINKFNAVKSREFYNICKGGEAGPGGPKFKGHNHSEETKRLMSENRKGSKNSNYGNRYSLPPEIRIKHSQPGEKNGMYGYHFSDEQKEILSKKASSKRWVSNEYETIRISDEDLETYLSNGYVRGRKLKCSSTTIES